MSRPNLTGVLFGFLGVWLLAQPVQARDRIRIVGSSTVYPFATIVAERFGTKQKKPTPVIESTGTGGGMKLFCGGVGPNHPDLTNASRSIKDTELEMCRANGVVDIIEVVIGNDGIAFANSSKGKKYNFSKTELWKAMAAKGPLPKRWNQINPALPDAEIQILTPPPTSGTRDAWNDLVMHKGCDPKVLEANKDDCALMREDGAVIEAGENDALIVQKLAANPNAFGIFGFSYLDSNRDKIQAATIDGVEISLDSIQSYKYPIARPLFFYVKKAHINVIPGMQEYLVEFTSNASMGEDGYLAEAGLVPLDPAKLKEVQATARDLTVMK